MSEGTVEGAEVTCPWHGAMAEVAEGVVYVNGVRAQRGNEKAAA